MGPGRADPDFAHPATVRGPDGKPFDFFCGGDTFLPDGTLLSAGGNLAYPGHGHGNLGRADCLGFDPVAGQWRHLGKMAHGRWYPTLLPLQDGRVLAVSGLNDTDGTLNPTFEVYDPAADHWHQLDVPQGGLFFGMPLYAHLFLLRDGRVLFTGGRMDDPSPQGPVTMDLTTHPVTITGVPGLDDPVIRNQSASVLLPPAQDQRFMVLGGGPEDASNATGSTSVIDMREPHPQFRPGAAMSLPRMHLNAVLLPDRTVFVSGGALEPRGAGRRPAGVGDLRPRGRRVADRGRRRRSCGSTTPSRCCCPTAGSSRRAETREGGDQVAWEPPDERRSCGWRSTARPTCSRGPRTGDLRGADRVRPTGGRSRSARATADVAWLSLIRPGSTTHAFDNSQRLVDLPITGRTGGTVHASAPGQSTVAPPGWYMLFLVDAAGVPSVASWVHLTSRGRREATRDARLAPARHGRRARAAVRHHGAAVLGITESLSNIFQMRAKYLLTGMRAMLDGPGGAGCGRSERRWSDGGRT